MEGWWEEKREGEGRTEGVKEGARVRVCVQAREREQMILLLCIIKFNPHTIYVDTFI